MATKTGTKKHKLSTTENPCPKKFPSIHTTDPQQVKKNTEEIFKIALRKFTHQEYLGKTQVGLHKGDDNKQKTKNASKVAKISASGGSRLTFDGIHTEESAGDHAEEDEDSQQGSLEFDTDIVSDSIGGAKVKAEESKDEHEEYETDLERQNQLQAIANRLGEIGDEFQRMNQDDNNFQQELLTCATTIASQEIDQIFETSINSFLNSQQQSLPDASDQHKVALVLLCAQKAISLASKPVEAASREADRMISHAVSFVVKHFPSWLGGAL